jgi:hypothetical protein
MEIAAVPYRKERETEWNRFVAGSKNGTFLFDRRFMDYHADRFDDRSLLLYADGVLAALFPAHVAGTDAVSHGGLSYGGIVTDRRMQAGTMLRIMDALLSYYRALGAKALVYKPVPSVYHRHPAEEDVYALFRAGAELFRVDMSATVDLSSPLPLSKGKKCGLSKARKAALCFRKRGDYAGFWRLLEDVLCRRHAAVPTHSLEEITLLAERFPDNIALYTAESGEEIAAGCVMFVTDRVAHTQYMAASEKGRETGALDALVHRLMTETYADRRYFDFGVSTENGGRVLNEGLAGQKEGFGGRGTARLFFKAGL